jgi:hypothetical protein
MGFKTIKEHYDIKHLVQVDIRSEYREPCIYIGSPYYSDIIVIRIRDAKIVKHYEDNHEQLSRYDAALTVDEKNGVLRQLIDRADVFEKDLPVFTVKGGYVVKELCEEYGWPNTTHTGKLMYNNSYSETKEKAYDILLKITKLNIKLTLRDISIRFPSYFQNIKRDLNSLIQDWTCWLVARTVGRFITKEEKS